MPKSTKRASSVPRRENGSAADDYGAKVSYEVVGDPRRTTHPDAPYPSGDPLSGIVLVAEPAPSAVLSARLADALRRSLSAVGLDEAYVTWSPSGLLLEELLSLEPEILVAVGPAAARSIDDTGYPLARAGFRDAPEGVWFSWTKGTAGLLLPDLAPAFEDPEAKKRFWRAFLALRDLAPGGAR